jgi:hypothetical protein
MLNSDIIHSHANIQTSLQWLQLEIVVTQMVPPPPRGSLLSTPTPTTSTTTAATGTATTRLSVDTRDNGDDDYDDDDDEFADDDINGINDENDGGGVYRFLGDFGEATVPLGAISLINYIVALVRKVVGIGRFAIRF